MDQPPPEGYARWTGPLLAAALGDVDVQHVWRLLRAQKIDLAGRKSWCESNDPEFVAKAADVVGLYMAPPENAIVICVDEKPSIQALERAQGYLKLPNGRALTGHSHDYKRNGTTTLFAAFEVATGKVTAAHKTRRRRIEFLDFMNDIVAAHADTAIHVVLDNLNTHKPRNDRWLRRHPNVHFHFTPTQAPLEYMLSVMRDDNAEPKRHDAMAMAAAPYLDSKLSTIELKPDASEKSEGTHIRVTFVGPRPGQEPDDDYNVRLAQAVRDDVLFASPRRYRNRTSGRGCTRHARNGGLAHRYHQQH